VHKNVLFLLKNCKKSPSARLPCLQRLPSPLTPLHHWEILARPLILIADDEARLSLKHSVKYCLNSVTALFGTEVLSYIK